MLVEITEAQFKQLIPGSQLVGANEGGMTYRTVSGRLFTKIHDGTRWTYAIIKK